MNIMMITSEAVPFYKTGGLADMVTSLSRSLSSFGHNVSIYMPLYDDKNRNFSVEYIGASDIQLAHGTETVGYAKALEGDITYYFMLHPIFGDRKGIYAENGNSYEDTLKRQTIFTKSLTGLISNTGLKIDVIHAHDWMTGLFPYYYKDKYKSVFTIHNIGYKGLSNAFEAIPLSLVLDESSFETTSEGVRIINSLKSAILNSNIITTVSPTYAKEILTPRFGEQLEGYLKQREDSLFGILNGIDENVWNPEKDKHLGDLTYTATNLTNKAALKKKALSEFGFSKNDKRPLIAIISRLASQKGFYETISNMPQSALDHILQQNNCLFAVIGTGDKKLEDDFRAFDAKYENFSFKNTFSEPLSHLLEAGSDFFLMPSVYEPCGLNQMYSLKYGSIPIVHKTGGLADTVIDENDSKEHPTGFVMDSLKTEEIENTINRAIMCYNKDNSKYLAIQQNAMKCRFDWGQGAQEYISLYNKLLNEE